MSDKVHNFLGGPLDGALMRIPADLSTWLVPIAPKIVFSLEPPSFQDLMTKVEVEKYHRQTNRTFMHESEIFP